MTGVFFAGFLLGLSVAALVGSAAMLVMEVSIQRGFGVAVAAGTGIATGDALWAAFAVAAGTIISRILAPWAAVLHWIALGALVAIGVLAVRHLVRPDLVTQSAEALPESPIRAYCTFLAFTLINSVTVMLFVSLIIGAAPHYRAIDAIVFVVGVFVASLSWQLGLAIAGTRHRGAFSSRARRRVLLLDGFLLALFIVYIALGLYRH